jgi:hypothetical protein
MRGTRCLLRFDDTLSHLRVVPILQAPRPRLTPSRHSGPPRARRRRPSEQALVGARRDDVVALTCSSGWPVTESFSPCRAWLRTSPARGRSSGQRAGRRVRAVARLAARRARTPAEVGVRWRTTPPRCRAHAPTPLRLLDVRSALAPPGCHANWRGTRRNRAFAGGAALFRAACRVPEKELLTSDADLPTSDGLVLGGS